MNKQQLVESLVERTRLESSLNQQELDTIISELSDDEDEEDEEQVTSSDDNHSASSDSIATPSSLADFVSPRTIPTLSPSNNTDVSATSTSNNELRIQLQKRRMEMDQLHRQYQLKLTEMSEQHENERHLAELEIIKLKSTLKMNDQKMKQLQVQLTKQMEQLQSKLTLIEKDVVISRELKEELKKEKLIIDEHTFIELSKSIPRENMSLKQFIQCQVFEIVQEFKHVISDLRRENTTLAENLNRTGSEYEILKHQTTHLNKLKTELDIEYKKQLDLYTAKNEKLTEELKDMTIQLNEYQSKATMFDTYKLKSDDLESKSVKLEHKLQVIESQLHIETKEKDQLIKKLASTTQQLELLKNDKSYLTKENEQLSNQNRKLQDDYDRLHEKSKETKRQKNEYYDRLLQVKDDSKFDADRNMQSEVKKLREKMKKDLAQIKQNAQESFERENRMLRDAKDHAESQFEKCRLQLKESQEAYDQLTHEYNTLKNNMEKQLNQMTSDMSVKHFKVETMTMTLMQSESSLKQVQGEIEVMRKKFDVLKTAYYTLDSDSKEKIAKLTTLLDSKERELANYIQIEKELDKALESVGLLEEEKVGDSRVSDLTAMVPTNATRRMRYSIYLVRKASELEKTIVEYKKDLAIKDQNIAALTSQLNKSKLQLDKVSQPYNYLVSAIETKEQQIEKQQGLIVNIEKDLKRFKEENEKLRFAKTQLEKDLEQLLNQKTVINKLKNVLTEIKSDNKKILTTNTISQITSHIQNTSSSPVTTNATRSSEQIPPTKPGKTIIMNNMSLASSQSSTEDHDGVFVGLTQISK